MELAAANRMKSPREMAASKPKIKGEPALVKKVRNFFIFHLLV